MNHRRRRVAHRLEGAGNDQGQVGGADVGRLSGDRIPGLPDVGIVGAGGHVVRRRPAVDMDEETLSRSWVEAEVAIGVGRRLESGLGAVDRDRRAFQGHVDRASGVVDGELGGHHPAADRGAGDEGEVEGAELEEVDAPGHAVAVGIDLPAPDVPQLVAVDRDLDRGGGGQRVSVEEGDAPGVGRKVEPGRQVRSAGLGMDGGRGDARGIEHPAETEGGLPGHRHVALGLGRAARGEGDQRLGSEVAVDVEHQVDRPRPHDDREGLHGTGAVGGEGEDGVVGARQARGEVDGAGEGAGSIAREESHEARAARRDHGQVHHHGRGVGGDPTAAGDRDVSRHPRDQDRTAVGPVRIAGVEEATGSHGVERNPAVRRRDPAFPEDPEHPGERHRKEHRRPTLSRHRSLLSHIPRGDTPRLQTAPWRPGIPSLACSLLRTGKTSLV